MTLIPCPESAPHDGCSDACHGTGFIPACIDCEEAPQAPCFGPRCEACAAKHHQEQREAEESERADYRAFQRAGGVR